MAVSNIFGVVVFLPTNMNTSNSTTERFSWGDFSLRQRGPEMAGSVTFVTEINR